MKQAACALIIAEYPGEDAAMYAEVHCCDFKIILRKHQRGNPFLYECLHRRFMCCRAVDSVRPDFFIQYAGLATM
ncbi:hypothetical protein CFU_3582 [Collimonas fungivorans Ter331]|uniref:Uncharacterized protein n=1 Tax=Collimonas fungivorans (strain Ter331) TaxID=1005048 RepID=G0ADE4_COLFT|nr:hypothetical protein CFU_3582 [Collimonas fungivorans Ter331]